MRVVRKLQFPNNFHRKQQSAERFAGLAGNGVAAATNRVAEQVHEERQEEQVPGAAGSALTALLLGLVAGCPTSSGGDDTVAVTGVSLDKATLNLAVGETATLIATVSPGDATDKAVVWSSSAAGKAAVSDGGEVTAGAAGTATITVTTTDGGFTATCAVTVYTPNTNAITSVTITGAAKVGVALTAEAKDGDGATVTDAAFQWKRADSAEGTYTDITSATGASSTPVADDAGKYLKAAATNAKTTTAVLSSATAAVEAAEGGGSTDITYTAAADGASGTTTSTRIDFTFSTAVTELTADDITLTSGTGAATKGALTGSGTAWSLALTDVTTEGNVTVSISKSGIESGAKTVAVYKASSSGEDDEPYAGSPILGTWERTVPMYGTSMTVTFTFNADGAVTITMTGEDPMEGTFTIEGTTLTLTQGGTPVTFTYSISGGTLTLSGGTGTAGGGLNGTYTKSSGSSGEGEGEGEGETFVPVTDITLTSDTTATVGTPLTLAATVTPENATNQTIAWSVKTAGTTGATIDDGKLNATAAGTVIITATITNGKTATENYTKDFEITTVKSLAGVLADLLAALPEGSADEPGTLVVPAGTDVSSNWAAIGTAVTGKYVILDLSACTATSNTITGKGDSTSTYYSNVSISANSYIKGIILPDTLTTIGSYAFYDCSALTSVTIPASVTSIANYAFNGCTNLATITVRRYEAEGSPKITSLSGTAAFGSTSLKNIYVPSAGVDAYKAATNWSTFAAYIFAIEEE